MAAKSPVIPKVTLPQQVKIETPVRSVVAIGTYGMISRSGGPSRRAAAGGPAHSW